MKGPVRQGGVGDHTLCERHNNETGHWYAPYFIDWCYQGMEILERSGGNPSLIYMNFLFPLPILKQIVTMFFSVNVPTFASVNPELVRFVLDRDRKHLSPKYRFFVYYNVEGPFRRVGLTGRWQGDLVGVGRSQTTLMSEINYPPFGYLMTIDSDPPDGRLFEITHFADNDYDKFRVMNIKLPVLPTHMIYPADYRTRDEIAEQERRSRARQLARQLGNHQKIA